MFRPRDQNAPGKIDQISPASYSHRNAPGIVIASATLLGPVLMD